MDERVRVFLWLLGWGCGGAVLGAAFGALAGALYWRSGRASGTRLALHVAETFGRLAGRELSPGAKGGLVGALDGFLFLGVVGTVVGAVLLRGGAPVEVLRPALLLAMLLIAGAAFFGVLAYTLTRAGVRALAPVSLGGILGALLGQYVSGTGGLLFGSVLGLVVGNLLGLFWPRSYEPRFAKPHLEHRPPGPHRPGDEGIQGSSGVQEPPE